jgi:MOSC domain-containing protein YiiM
MRRYREDVSDLVELLSVNVGVREVLARWPNKDVVSAIRKRPVSAESVEVGRLGIAGDHQADRRRIRGVQVHGGPGKAVYAYPAEHFAGWAESLGQQIGAGSFGENLTVRGLTEAEAYIGDIWRWGDSLLQISEPRGPCYKLDLHRGDERTGERMNATGATGWYLRVLEPGSAPTGGMIAVESRHESRVPVVAVHRLWQGRDHEALANLLELEALGADLKQMIRNRLSRRRARPA